MGDDHQPEHARPEAAPGLSEDEQESICICAPWVRDGLAKGTRTTHTHTCDQHRTAVERILTARRLADLAEIKADALREHRHEWADYFENWSGAIGPEPPTVETMIAALRRETVPFGRSIGGNPDGQ